MTDEAEGALLLFMEGAAMLGWGLWNQIAQVRSNHIASGLCGLAVYQGNITISSEQRAHVRTK